MGDYNEKLIQLLNMMEFSRSTLETQPHTSVHEFRKCTKYMRALLKFIPNEAKSIDKQLKSASQILSPFRDAQVNLETYQNTALENDSLRDPELERLLIEKSQPVGPFADYFDIKVLDKKLHKIQYHLNAIASHPSPSEVNTGVRKSYNSGKAWMSQVNERSTHDIVHSWRKKTKRLWYQLRFLAGDEHHDPHHLVNAGDHLGAVLGEIHDLDMFQLAYHEHLNEQFSHAILDRRNTLLTESMISGEKIYNSGSDDFYNILDQLTT